MQHIIVLTCALAGSLSVAGCASDAHHARASLPFRLAVIPFEKRDLEERLTTASEPQHALALGFDARTASKALLEELTGESFTEVVLLDGPDAPGREELASWTGEKRDRYWTRIARERKANLIMECDLKASDSVYSSLNEKFWLNLPLFLVGGPLSYFVDDRSYFVRGRLGVKLHLLDPILDGRATLADGRAELFRSEVNFTETSLDFIDRTGTSLLAYLPSILVPVGFLSVANDNVRSHIRNEMARAMARALKQAIEDSSRSILQADQVVEFFLDPDLIVVSDESGLSVRGEAILRHGRARRMDSFTISDGSNSVSGEFGPGIVDGVRSTRRERYSRYTFVGRLPSGSAGFLEIELVAGGREKHRRTFTVDVSPVGTGGTQL